jgi:hypothetical protein
MMKLVVFGAIASATLTPLVRLAQSGAVSWPFAILMDAAGVPIVLAVAAFLLVQSGPLRDWLVRSLLLASIGVIIGAAVYSLFWASTGPQWLNVWASPTIAVPVGFIHTVLAILGIPFVLLMPQVVPGRCPACRALTLFPESTMQNRSECAQRRARRCASCQGRFQKVSGSWRAIPSLSHPQVP